MIQNRVLKRYGDDIRVRFLIGGGIAALINWVVRFPLNLVMPYSFAVIGAMAVGMTCGFLLYRAWVFPPSSRRTWLQVRDFVLVNLAGMAVTVLVAILLRLLLLQMAAGATLAAAAGHAAGIAAGALANFVGHRNFTFR